MYVLRGGICAEDGGAGIVGAGGVNKQMKAEDMMKWVGLMNNFRNMTHEVVLKEFVYA